MVQTLDPASDVLIGTGWAINGGLPTAWETLSDASDGTYMSGGNTVGTGNYTEVALDAGNDPGASGLHRVHFRCTRRNASFLPVLLSVALYDGTTLVATRQHAQPPPGAPMQDNSYDLTAGEVALITDYADLRIRLIDDQSQGTALHLVAKCYVELGDPPSAIADFLGSPTSGPATLDVNFTNLSDTSGGDGRLSDWTYLWSFGAGEGTSADVHPSHSYTTPGTFDVSLEVTAPGGNDTETKLGYIVVSDPAAPLEGQQSMAVDSYGRTAEAVVAYGEWPT